MPADVQFIEYKPLNTSNKRRKSPNSLSDSKFLAYLPLRATDQCGISSVTIYRISSIPAGDVQSM